MPRAGSWPLLPMAAEFPCSTKPGPCNRPVRVPLRVPGHDLEGLYDQLDFNNSNLPRRNEIFWRIYKLGWQLGERHSRSRKWRPNLSDEGEQLLNRVKASEGLQSCSRLCCCLVAIDPGRINFSAYVRCPYVFHESSRRVSRA